MCSVTDVVVMNNPAGFTQPLQFRITFTSQQNLEEDLEWKLVYVGSAEDTTRDQVLEEVMVGPVHVGVNEFVLQAEAPDATNIPQNDLVGVTVVLITASYKEKEFLRVGYYVNNEHRDPAVNEAIAEGRPVGILISVGDITRNILADRPRVTRFPIDWGNGDPSAAPAAVADAGGSSGVAGAADGGAACLSSMLDDDAADRGDVAMDEGDEEDEEDEDDEEGGDGEHDIADCEEDLGDEDSASSSDGENGSTSPGGPAAAAGNGVEAMDQSFEAGATVSVTG